ncbi:hypothetical protein Tco_1485875 [Tanacetum coccineum]
MSYRKSFRYLTSRQTSNCFEVLKHILGEPADETSSSNSSPPTPELLKIDSIVLSWIFMTLSETLQARLLVEDPQTANEAWDLIALIFNDNKPVLQKSKRSGGLLAWCQAMAPVLAMAHHSVVGAKASRLWLTTPLNSGAILNLVPNFIFFTFFSMARAYGTTTPSALRQQVPTIRKY